MTARGNLEAVRNVLGGAEEPPIDEFDGRGAGGDDEPPLAMPAGCPVEPLGTHDGVFYFLTTLGELRPLKARDVGNKDIVGMFAPMVDYLYQTWPNKSLRTVVDEDGQPVKDVNNRNVKEWIVTGWKTAEVTEQLLAVAGARGVWNPRDKVRGRGAHRDETGRLILHCGDWILAGGAWRRPGIIDEFVYPTAPAIPRPGKNDQVFTIDGPGGEQEVSVGLALMHWLKHWHWTRPSVDPILLLGFLAVARLGGAIDWRPLAWLTGGAGEGKSTLMDLIGDLFDGGLLKLEKASEAAVRQLLGQDTLPVVLDEAESEEDDRQMQAIIGLARIAASGGKTGKGGSDHQGVQFAARSCFLFSSILIPPLGAADKSRMAMLELRKLAGGRPPAIVRHDRKPERRAMAAAITRRMVDNWGRWEKTFEAYSVALIEYGEHRGRGAYLFASLLAAAHILLDDEPPAEDELQHWGKELAVSRLAELADADGDDKRVMHHLATSPVQLDSRGAQRMVSEWVQQATEYPREGASKDVVDDFSAKRAFALTALGRIGIGIHVAKKRKSAAEDADDRPQPVPGRTYVVVANAHQGLGKLFQESGWKGGVWTQSLKRIPGAVPNERQRIAGRLMACTLVPIETLWGDEPATADGSAEAAQAAEEREDA